MIASPTGSRGIRVCPGAAAGGLGLHQGQGADARRRPSTAIAGPGHCETRPRRRSCPRRSARSGPREPSASARLAGPRSGILRSGRRPDGSSAAGSAPETGRSATPRPRCRPRRDRPAAREPSVSSSGWGQVPGARASHCTASVGCIPVTRQTRSRSSWGSSIASKITRRYWGGVVGMIGADSRQQAVSAQHVNDRAAARSSSRVAGRFSSARLWRRVASAFRTARRPGRRNRAGHRRRRAASRPSAG